MKVFLSYAHEQRLIAEEVCQSLRVHDFEVFFDRSSLKPGLEYDATIRKTIKGCDLFVFFISPDSVRKGSYALTELGFAKDKWTNPSGKVLPVMAKPTLHSRIDAYLRAVTILYPQGNLPAEVTANVAALGKRKGAEQPDAPPGKELLYERMSAYKQLWELTRLLPKWPRATGVTYKHLRDLSHSLRDWYFHEGGGMFLSRATHSSYAALQDSLTAILIEKPSGNITDEHYDVVRELCSMLRTGFARDVGSRV